MSGFLERMATRAVAGEGSAAPRLPSRFEPPAVATSSEVAEGSGPEGGAVDSVREPLRSVDRTPPPRVDPSRTVRPGEASRPSPRRDDARHGNHVAAATLPESFAPAASDHGAADEQRRRTDLQPGPRPAALTGLGGVAPSARNVLDSQVALPTAAALVRAVPTSGDDELPGAGVAAGAEPVVTITIGRVDVRATVAAPPVAPPPVRDTAAGAESLSLHDYLHGSREPR